MKFVHKSFFYIWMTAVTLMVAPTFAVADELPGEGTVPFEEQYGSNDDAMGITEGGVVDTTDAFGVTLGLQSSSDSELTWSPNAAISWWFSSSSALAGGVSIKDLEETGAQSVPGSESDGAAFMRTNYREVRFELTVLHALRVGKTTRLKAEGGVSFANTSVDVTVFNDDSMGSPALGPSALSIGVPVGLSVEHFFTPTITASVGTRFYLLNIDEQAFSGDTPSSNYFGFDTSQLAVHLTWYSD